MSTKLTLTGLQAQELAYAQEMARIAHEAGIVPPNTKAATISAIILAGREMGMQPFHALRSLYFVQGRLLMSVQAQLALARRAGVKVIALKDEPNACTVTLARGDEQVTTTYSLEDAKRAGLLDKANSNWAKYPRQMLRWRAIGDALRIVAPDVLLGVYDPNEFAEPMSFAEPMNAKPLMENEPTDPTVPADPTEPAESAELTEPRRRVIPAKPAEPVLDQNAVNTTDLIDPDDEEIDPKDFGLVIPSAIDENNPPLEELDASIKNSWLRRLYGVSRGKFKTDEDRKEWLQRNFKKRSFTALTLAEAREAIDLLRMSTHR